MTDDITQMPVIDVDSHWTAPPDLWSKRAPEKFRDRVLRVAKHAEGVEQWVIEDGQVMARRVLHVRFSFDERIDSRGAQSPSAPG